VPNAHLFGGQNEGSSAAWYHNLPDDSWLTVSSDFLAPEALLWLQPALLEQLELAPGTKVRQEGSRPKSAAALLPQAVMLS